VATLLAAGYVKNFRILGRHFTPLMPVILFILWRGLRARWERPHWVSKPFVFGFVILSLVSCFSFRFAWRHERDDYRDAAAYAKAALRAGVEGVWWNAGREGAIYYRVPLTEQGGQNDSVLWLMNPTSDTLSHLPPPEIILLSKLDVYDGYGTIANYLVSGGYFKTAAMPAFSIWHKKADSGKPLGPRLVREFY